MACSQFHKRSNGYLIVEKLEFTEFSWSKLSNFELSAVP